MAGANRVVVDGVSYPIDDATAVDFEEQQTLTDAQKTRARSNIDAASQDDMTSVQAAVGDVPSGSNLQGEVADLKSAINNTVISRYSLDATPTIPYNISPSTGKWSQNVNSYQSYYFSKPKDVSVMRIKAGENGTSYALLAATDTPAHNTAPVYATGCTRMNNTANLDTYIIIPDDCAYIWITKTISGTDRQPEYIGFGIPQNLSETVDLIKDNVNALNKELVGLENIDLSLEQTYNYYISKDTKKWTGTGNRYCYIVNVEKRISISIEANSTAIAEIAFLQNSTHLNAAVPNYCDGFYGLTSIDIGNSMTFYLPDDCNYVYICKTYLDADEEPENVSVSYIDVDKLMLRSATPSQIFNVNLANAAEYAILANYTDEGISSNGYTPAIGWENRLKINKYIVCDTVAFQATVKLGTANSGVCALGAESSLGSNHGTIVKFDFENALVSFLTGSSAEGGANIDGKTIPEYTYDSFALENLSGVDYRLEIGRKNRCVYAKVYNLKTAQLCGEKVLDIYATSSSYGGKAGALYDCPNVGVLSGAITIKRISACVPTGVFAVFIGDSITEGSQLALADVWANKCITYLGSGLNCGRGGGYITSALACVADVVPAIAPKYVVVTIGTNGTVTGAQYASLVNGIKNAGAIPIINHIPMNTRGNVETVNALIEALGVDSAHFDVATAINNDPAQGQNTAMFQSDKLHPNAAGGVAMYNQFVADLGWIKQES